ncbi:MAG: dephospho-CoA kinase [Alphaproteobacteria bacterium]|nr:dephospho-CoA kinase [Alphaproteobacteria bacterium]
MLIIGLTGSIGMGKSTAAGILKKMGYPIYDADKAVHALLKKDGDAVAPIAGIFPEALKKNAIDRKILGRAVFGDAQKLRRLERILHPLIRKAERAFLKNARARKARAAILEIPLLFETGGEKRCDVTMCVTAPRAIQRARVMARPHMTEEKFRAIVARQMPDKAKRARADFTVPTGIDEAHTRAHLQKILRRLGLEP